MNIFAAKEGDDGVVREIVLPPIAELPDGSRLMVVLPTLKAEPPAEILLPAVEMAEGFGVKVWPTAKTAADMGFVREKVLLPSTNIPD